MASSGLDTTMIMAWGGFTVDFRLTSLTIPAFTFRRSSRLIPGFRGRPEVMTMMSEPAVSSYPLVPVTIVSYPYTGPDCMRSSAFPCGIPSTMLTSTTSQKSFSASRGAGLAPTFPAPITVIFFRLIASLPGAVPFGPVPFSPSQDVGNGPVPRRNRSLEAGHHNLHPRDNMGFSGQEWEMGPPKPCIPYTKALGMSSPFPAKGEQAGGVDGRPHQVDAPADLFRLPDPQGGEKD